MTEHRKLLQAVLEGLDEGARLAFLKETLASLPPHLREELIREAAQMPASPPAPLEMAQEIAAEALPFWQQTHPPVTDSQESVDPLPSPHSLTKELAGKDYEKNAKVMSALNQFEMLKQTQAQNQKKILRKEVFSCLGFGLLGLGLIVAASMGLKYLWQILFP